LPYNLALMKAHGKIRITLYILGFAGAALFTLLLVRQGVPAIGAALRTAGWGIALVTLFHLLPILLDAIAWWVLFPSAGRPSWRSLFWMRWIGESVSNLVPSAMIGGDLLRARLATISGTPVALAAASVIVDVTLGVVTQIIFTLLGLALLARATGGTELVGPTLIGTVLGVAAILGFYIAQRLGMFRFLSVMVTRLVKSPEWSSLVQSGEALDQTVRALYARRSGVLLCCLWTIVSLVISSGEVWIALWALNAHPTFLHALILQSMAMTVRNAAFAVPGQLGVQEGGYLVIGNLLGIPGDTAFAISLIARFRDLAIGIPGLITWQVIEGKRLLRERMAGANR
jgi:putative membrane protein